MRWYDLVLAVGAIWLGLAPDAALAAKQCPTPDGHLERIVILSRHGVRSPTQTPTELKEWHPRGPEWPDFGVPPGYLTPRGEQLAEAMGRYYRRYLNHRRVFSPERCPTELSIRADLDQRTLMTAQAIGRGLTRTPSVTECRFSIDQAGTEFVQKNTGASAMTDKSGEVDRLFHPTYPGLKNNGCSLDPNEVDRLISSEAIGALRAVNAPDMETEQTILGCCACAPGQTCTLLTLPSSAHVSETNGQASIKGGLGIAQSFAEILLLEYAQGFEWSKIGFGHKPLDLSIIQRLLRVHTSVFNRVQRVPYIADRQGGDLFHHITQAIATGRDPGASGSARKFIAYVGHDTNIANVATFLDMHWDAPGYQRDDMPPAGALAFEVWRADGKEATVHARFVSQSPEALRGPAAEAEPDCVQAHMRSCEGVGDGCSMTRFTQMANVALANVPRACRTDR